MSEDHIYFNVTETGAMIRDTYRVLRVADLRELARQALEAVKKLERTHADWLREATAETEARLVALRAELKELEIDASEDAIAPLSGSGDTEVSGEAWKTALVGTCNRRW